MKVQLMLLSNCTSFLGNSAPTNYSNWHFGPEVGAVLIYNNYVLRLAQ